MNKIEIINLRLIMMMMMRRRRRRRRRGRRRRRIVPGYNLTLIERLNIFRLPFMRKAEDVCMPRIIPAIAKRVRVCLCVCGGVVSASDFFCLLQSQLPCSGDVLLSRVLPSDLD